MCPVTACVTCHTRGYEFVDLICLVQSEAVADVAVHSGVCCTVTGWRHPLHLTDMLLCQDDNIEFLTFESPSLSFKLSRRTGAAALFRLNGAQRQVARKTQEDTEARPTSNNTPKNVNLQLQTIHRLRVA